MTKLSILIPTLTERAEMLSKLLGQLAKQITNDVEIIVNMDNRDITLGAKENRLLESSKGEYVVFIDDDDWVSDDYISEVMKGIMSKVDIVQIKTNYWVDGEWEAEIHFNIGEGWYEKSPTVLQRGCAKFCPHRKEIAMQVMFEDINFVEDRPYAQGLDKLCKTEYVIEKPIYEYRYKTK